MPWKTGIGARRSEPCPCPESTSKGAHPRIRSSSTSMRKNPWESKWLRSHCLRLPPCSARTRRWSSLRYAIFQPSAESGSDTVRVEVEDIDEGEWLVLEQ
jgi:hypothetical protein